MYTMQSCIMSFQSSPVILLNNTTNASDTVRKFTCLNDEHNFYYTFLLHIHILIELLYSQIIVIV